MRRQGSSAGTAYPHRRSLGVLFDPRSIAVVGASDDSAKWGHVLSRRALESSGGRPVTLVNRRGNDVLGRPTHRTLVAAREAGDLVDLLLSERRGFCDLGVDPPAGAGRDVTG